MNSADHHQPVHEHGFNPLVSADVEAAARHAMYSSVWAHTFGYILRHRRFGGLVRSLIYLILQASEDSDEDYRDQQPALEESQHM